MKNRENLFLRQGRATGFSKRLFACLLLGSLTLGNAMAQNIKRITLQLKNAQLEKVLSTIKEQTGMRLIYSDEDIANIPPVNINVKDMPMAIHIINRKALIRREQPMSVSPSTMSMIPLISGTPGIR